MAERPVQTTALLPPGVTVTSWPGKILSLALSPDGRALVTEKEGALKLLAGPNEIYDVAGVPVVAYGGQGGLGDGLTPI